MSRCFVVCVALPILCLESPSSCAESAENRSSEAWSVEGISGYRSFDVREYSLGLNRLDHASGSGAGVVLSRIWTNRAYYGNRNDWKLNGHSISANYRQFLGHSFFAEASLLAEAFRAWADAEAEDFGNAQRLALTVQCGNQWQWEHLNFGITWLGKIIPLSYRADHSGRNGSFHSYLTEPSNLGIRISVGWVI